MTPRKTPTKKPKAKAKRKPVGPYPPLPIHLHGLYRQLEVPFEDWRQPSGRVIAFAHTLIVPAGKHLNKPLRLRPYQIEFIRDVYNLLDPVTKLRKRRQAVLSIGRRGGKTLTAAVIMLAHL